MKSDQNIIYLIESLAANAWPASVEENFGQWKLRANDGVTKRANSVFTIGDLPHKENWLQNIEHFYLEKSLSPCFYISELSPAKLDPFLIKNGYNKTGELDLMLTTSSHILEETKDIKGLTVQFVSEASDQWVNHFLHLENFLPSTFKAYHSIFSAIQLKKIFISIYLRGKLVGLGTVAVENEWGYLCNIVVDHMARRQGIASQIIRNLSKWAYEHGVTHLCLQVVKENIPAINLYKKLGFTQVASSYYRIRT